MNDWGVSIFSRLRALLRIQKKPPAHAGDLSVTAAGFKPATF